MGGEHAMQDKLDGRGLFTPSRGLGVISSSWHGELVGIARTSLVDALRGMDVDVDTALTFVQVPGALEFPFLAKQMALTGRFAAIAVIALVVDGGIYRHDFVASAIIHGIVQVSLETGVPVMSASLTPHHFHEHEPHQAFFRQHLVAKGEELARACVSIVRTTERIKHSADTHIIAS